MSMAYCIRCNGHKFNCEFCLNCKKIDQKIREFYNVYNALDSMIYYSGAFDYIIAKKFLNTTKRCYYEQIT